MESTEKLPSTQKNFRAPQTTIVFFVARRTIKIAIVISVLFSVLLAVKADGIATAYPTQAARSRLAITFGNNLGLKALFGQTNHLNAFGGFIAWNMLSPMLIIGGLWIVLLATKTFRGEEDAGRTELLMSGMTTAKRTAFSILIGLSFSCLALFVCTAVLFTLVGRIPAIHLAPEAMVYYALCVSSSIALFMCIGALASQLMATRGSAAKVAAAAFGVSFLVRVMADVTSAHWLDYITPLGWIEKLQPLYDPQPEWLIPVAATIIAVGGLAIVLAGQRDLNASIVSDHVSASPHTRLLNSPIQALFRLTRSSNLSWLAAVMAVAAFFGFLTKSAATAISQSAGFGQKLSKITNSAQTNKALLFLSIVYFLLSLFVMVYVASTVNSMRSDEANGYLENFLVRSVGRLQWLWDRLGLCTIFIIVIGVFSSSVIWLAANQQHLDISYRTLLEASCNIIAAGIFTLGLGTFAMSFAPRKASIIVYGSIIWAFLLDIASSGINLNHWILDTSIMKQLSAVPSTSPSWTPVVVMIAVGFIFCTFGSDRFSNRDIVNE